MAPHWEGLLAQAWEDLCRRAVPTLTRGALARLGPWHAPQRYWRGAEPEWDLVADALQGSRTLVGEAWCSRTPVTPAGLRREATRLAARALPPPVHGRAVVRALFVPAVQAGAPRRIGDVHIVTLGEMI